MVRPISDASTGEQLRDVRETERLGSYLSALWQRRYYMWYVARSELRSRQINSILGNLWHLLNPLLQISVFFLIFGLVLDTRRGVDNFFGYLAIGIFTYSFFQKSATNGGGSIIKNRSLIQIVSFPRATLPLTTTLTETLATIPPYLVLFLVATVTGEPPKLIWLLILPVALVQAVFNAGVAMVVARAANRIPDVLQILPFVFRLGFYASGVLFNVNAYLEGSPYKVIFQLNPVYCFIEINRGLLLEGTALDGRLVVTALVWTVALFVGGFLWFRRAEDSYGKR